MRKMSLVVLMVGVALFVGSANALAWIGLPNSGDYPFVKAGNTLHISSDGAIVNAIYQWGGGYMDVSSLSLTDPDGDGVYKGDFVIPEYTNTGDKCLDGKWTVSGTGAGYFTLDNTPPLVTSGNDVVAIPGTEVKLSGIAFEATAYWVSSGLDTDSLKWTLPDGSTVSGQTLFVNVGYESFDNVYTFSASDKLGNTASDSVRVLSIADYIGDLLPPGLNKIMERGGVGK